MLGSGLGSKSILNPFKGNHVEQSRVLSWVVRPPAMDCAQIDPVPEDPEHQVLGPGMFARHSLGLEGNLQIVEGFAFWLDHYTRFWGVIPTLLGNGIGDRFP